MDIAVIVIILKPRYWIELSSCIFAHYIPLSMDHPEGLHIFQNVWVMPKACKLDKIIKYYIDYIRISIKNVNIKYDQIEMK